MNDLGPLRSFLALEIHRNRPLRRLHLLETKYISKFLAEHGMLSCNPSHMSADIHMHLGRKSNPLAEFKATAADKQAYHSAVGSLMYAILGTRPDLAYAVSKVSQYRTNQSPTHWTAANRIFRYWAGTANRGLYYGSTGIRGGYTDAHWGSGGDRRSIGSYAFLLNGAAIS